jgi:hypothetical protein
LPEFSDYIVFVDDSGDHGMTTIDPNYPMFVLAFCVFHKEEYAATAVPAVLVARPIGGRSWTRTSRTGRSTSWPRSSGEVPRERCGDGG